MKIILCSLNSKYIHSSLGVWYLYSAAKNICSPHQIKVYESTINNQIEDIIADLLSENADVVGFSTYIWNIEYVKKAAETIKKVFPNIKIFFGGPQASYDANELIKNNYIDFIIKGEGEHAFATLLSKNFIVEEKIIEEKNKNLNYVNPYTDEYFAALNGRICYLETSRGCPFSCAFCLSGRDENVRFFPIEEAKKNILLLANSGTQTVKFVDRTFNCNDERAIEIFNFIKTEKEKGNIPNNVIFHFEVEADLFTEKSLNFLKTVPSGLFQFEAGLQSFNPKTLQGVNRRSDVDKLVNNLKSIISGNNIHLHIDLIAGLPYEDYQSFKESFNMAFSIQANVIQLGFLKLLKGSRLENQQELHGINCCSYPPFQVLSTKYISYNDLLKLKKAEDAVERLKNSQRFSITIDYLLKTTKLLPYDMFYEFGCYCHDKKLKASSLDSYSQALFDFFSKKEQVDANILRDCIAFDRITTDKTGRLFGFLHRPDERLKTINNIVKTVELSIFDRQIEKAKQGKIGFCILYSEQEQIVFTDYTSYDSVNNIYNYAIFPLKDILSLAAID